MLNCYLCTAFEISSDEPTETPTRTPKRSNVQDVENGMFIFIRVIRMF